MRVRAEDDVRVGDVVVESVAREFAGRPVPDFAQARILGLVPERVREPCRLVFELFPDPLLAHLAALDRELPLPLAQLLRPREHRICISGPVDELITLTAQAFEMFPTFAAARRMGAAVAETA